MGLMDQIERKALRRAIVKALPPNVWMRGRFARVIEVALEPWLAELAALRQSADQEQRQRYRDALHGDAGRVPPLE